MISLRLYSKELMKWGWVTKLASSTIYNIPSTYTGEKCGFINFEELNPTNNKLLGVNKVTIGGRIIGYKSLKLNNNLLFRAMWIICEELHSIK